MSKCGDLNGGQDKVICTINGFWMESGGSDGQPGPEFFEALWSKNPNQPAMWTEDQGWFDQWEYATLKVTSLSTISHPLLTHCSPISERLLTHTRARVSCASGVPGF